MFNTWSIISFTNDIASGWHGQMDSGISATSRRCRYCGSFSANSK